jgi:serine/threonine protein kinase
MSRNVIGEGAYGCVFKPSIHCLQNPNNEKDQKFRYKDYVSKIMKNKDAQMELNESIVIGSYDPSNVFHLGTPILCQPELNDKIINNEISKCKYIKSKDIKANPTDYKLLLMKFGGPDLKKLCSSELQSYLSTKATSRIKTDKFWLEVHHLIKGLKFFKENGIVHNDIKPQNILFNLKSGKLKFIDFGLMRSKDEIISSSKEGKNYLGIYHWSYPFECGIMNKPNYNAYNRLTAAKKTKYEEELYDMIIDDKTVNSFKMPISNPGAFNILFTYIDPDGNQPPDSTKYIYIDDYFDGINNLMSKYSYDTNLDRIIDSIDIYGLGFTLQYMLNCFYRQNAIDTDFFKRLSNFFYKMYNFNLEKRELDIDILINEYETILLETGILRRLKKTTIFTRKDKGLSKEDDSSDILKIRSCPQNKELNLVTNRCVKKCKPGQTRNTKFRCVSAKTRKIK